MRNMQTDPAEKIIVGAFLTVIGLGIILFHRSIKDTTQLSNEIARSVSTAGDPSHRIDASNDAYNLVKNTSQAHRPVFVP